jgi:hypothetical protein
MKNLNRNLVNIIGEAAYKISGNMKPTREEKISKETKDMLKQRREAKRGVTGIDRVQYVELCKNVRKKMSMEIRDYNTKKIRKVIEENRGLKVLKREMRKGSNQIITLKDEKGVRRSDRKEILDIVEKFYTSLYESIDENNGEEHERRGESGDMEEETPEIMAEEVKYAMNLMKKGKSPGEDGIQLEMLQLGGEEVVKILTRLFNLCLMNKKIPQEWEISRMILIFKKGDREEIGNYRPINLLPAIYKLFTKILTNRLTTILDSNQPREQAGFRKHYNTIDHIQTVRQVMEKSHEYRRPLVMTFIDYEKAFDTVCTGNMLMALRKQGVENAYQDIIKDIYSRAKSKIKVNLDDVTVPMKRGVRQGDTISPKLFTATLEDIFRDIEWNVQEGDEIYVRTESARNELEKRRRKKRKKKGIKIDGEWLTHLRFADDIVLFAENGLDMEEMIEEMAEKSKKCGLRMNLGKTKVMNNKYADQIQIMVDGKIIENVNSYIYLGQNIKIDEDQTEEIKRRTQMGWMAFGKLGYVLRGNIPICLKRKVFDQCILPVLIHGSESWTLTEEMIRKLRVTQRGMERSMLGITRKDRKTCEWIRGQTGVRDVLESAKSQKWRWTGHMLRSGENKWTKKVIGWWPREGKRGRGRPRKRWEDEIGERAGRQWRRKTEDREEWRYLGEAFVQQWTDHGR